MAKKVGSIKAKRYVSDVFTHTFLIIMAVIWLIPFVWLVAHSFRETPGLFVKTFLPTDWTLNNYKLLFTEKSVLNFPQMFKNTFIIAIFTCLISSFLVLAVSYCMSRLQWKMRKPYMNMGMVITLFPGFMSMTAQYFLLKALGLTEGDMVPLALIICYTSGSGVGFYVMKGYMDTIPKALDEAAYLDGATKWQTFITSFMGAWMDFVFAKIIVRANSKYFTVAIGLWSMLEKEYVDRFFTRFCAGAVLVAIPISVLYIITQRFYQEAMSGSVKG